MAAPRPAALLDKTNPASPLHHPSSTTALLLLDYQNFTLALLPDPHKTRVLTTATRLRAWAHANDILVFHCLVNARSPPAPTSKMSARWAPYAEKLARDPSLADEPALLTSTTPAGDTTPTAAAPKREDVTVLRRAGTISALKSEGLLPLLRGAGIASLVVAGLSTSGCVLGTAREAADEGFVVTVVEEGCWDLGEGVHEVICRGVLPASVNVVGVGELMEGWGEGR